MRKIEKRAMVCLLLAAALAAEREAFKASVDKAGREIEAKYA